VLGSLPPVEETPDGGVGAAGTGGAGGGSTTSTTATTSTAGGAGGCCDCDHDGVPAAGVCGGTDCDDHDGRAHPGQTMYFGTPASDPAVGFDFDCNGTTERNPDLLTTVNCGAIGLPCAAGTGFLAQVPPACGESAPWGSCMQNGLGCFADVVEANKVMTCK
jgi:hypothetical protein